MLLGTILKVESSCIKIIGYEYEGHQDGSASKQDRCQASQPEFNPWSPHSRGITNSAQLSSDLHSHAMVCIQPVNENDTVIFK